VRIVTYVAPQVAVSWGVTIPWFCGSNWERMECSGPGDYIRLDWDPDSRDINVRCYGMCGDGSSPEDCYAY